MKHTKKTLGKIFVVGSLFVVTYGATQQAALAAVVDYTACVRNLTLPTTNTSNSAALGQVSMWGFATTSGTANCMGLRLPKVPGNQIELGVGDTLNLTLDMMMSPLENAPPPSPNYNGHTIHLHGADVDAANDGVPETSKAILSGSYKYVWNTTLAPNTSSPIGSFMYHCHVHTVKHLEMGMYGAILVRPKNALGATITNQITTDSTSRFDNEQTYVVSAVDPNYHTVVGDSPVFADYNPKYFLLNGTEGTSITSPASAAVLLNVGTGKKVALHLVDPLSIYGTFSIKDAAGKPQQFIVYVEDGRAIDPVPTSANSVTSLEIGPGKRFDIIFTTPTTSGTLYPQIEFKNPRGETITLKNADGAITGNAMVYGQVTF